MTFLPKIHGPVSTINQLAPASLLALATLPIPPSSASIDHPVKSLPTAASSGYPHMSTVLTNHHLLPLRSWLTDSKPRATRQHRCVDQLPTAALRLGDDGLTLSRRRQAASTPNLAPADILVSILGTDAYVRDRTSPAQRQTTNPGCSPSARHDARPSDRPTRWTPGRWARAPLPN